MQMQSTKNAPLDALLVELDADSKHAPSNAGHRQKRQRPYRPSGEDRHLREDNPLRSDKSPIRSRVARTVAFFLFAVLVGAVATLIVFQPVAWLSPVSETQAPVPSVTAADLHEALKPLAVDLALVRRSMEQLGSNLDQLARNQDQLAQKIATLQAAAEQQVDQTASTPPAPPKAVSALPPSRKPVHVSLPPPKSLQPPAQ